MINRCGMRRGVPCLLLLPTLAVFTVQAQIMDSRWSQPFNLSDPAAQADRASVVMDRQGYTHALWVERYGDARAVVKYARFDGAVWSAPLLVRDPSPARIGITSLALDQAEQLHASWTEGVTASLFGARPIDAPVRYIRVAASAALDPGQWLSPVSIPVRAFTQSLRVAPDGAVHLIYTDLTRVPESVMHCRSVDGGVSWSSSAPFPWLRGVTGAPSQSTLEISAGGTLHAAWEHKFAGDWRTGAIAYSRSVDNGATWAEPRLLDEPRSDPSFLQYGWPQLAVHGSEVSVMWSGGGFAHVGRRFRLSRDDGLTWLPVEQLFHTLHGHSNGDALVYDWQGRLHYQDLLRFPEGIWESSLSGDEWSSPNLLYLHLRDAADQEYGRLHPSTLDLAAGNGQRVATFTAESARTQLFTIHLKKPTTYVPYFLAGGGTSARILISNRGEDPVRLTFKARTRDGEPMDAGFREDRNPIEIPGQATRVIQAAGPGEGVTAGYLEIDTEGVAPLLVTAVIREENGGQIVVPPLPAGRAFALPVELLSGVQIKLALLRFTGKPVEATLHDQSGWEAGRVSWTPEGRHQTSSLRDLFTIPEEFKGVLVLKSAGDFTILGLRVWEGRESYLPAINIEQAPDTGPTYIPHYAEGSGWSMSFAALNHGDAAVSVVTGFFDASGHAQSLPFEAGTVNETTLDLGPGGARILTTTGTSDVLKTGFVQFRFDRKASGFATFRSSDGLSASVAAGRPGHRFAIIVDDSVSAVTALALLRLHREPVEFRLYDAQGALITKGELPSNVVQVAGLVSHLAGFEGDFLGVLVVESKGAFHPLSLRIGSGVLGVNPAIEETTTSEAATPLEPGSMNP
jgi:hypothetical protein